MTLENQGFLFTRCTRCNHDMLRTVGSDDAKWRSVPAGFRVDWGKVDLRAFEDPSWIARSWRAALAVVTTIDLLVSSLWWGVMDGVHALRCAAKDMSVATRRALRIGAEPLDPSWNLAVHGPAKRRTAANDLGFAHGQRLVA
jgi:hypothetical protein